MVIKHLKNKGMSFLEIVVSLAIFSVILTAIFTVLFTGRLYWRIGTTQLDVQQQARQAISFIAKELRQTRAGTGRVAGGPAVAILENLPADDTAYTSVTFRVPQDGDGDGIVVNAGGQVVEWSDKITYCLNSTDGQIIRLIQDTTPCECPAPYTNCRVLANNMKPDDGVDPGLKFIRPSSAPKLIEVIITARKIIVGSSEPIEFVIRSWIRLRN
ncbi:MAG: prepilin-type N-terminal cleavage/methylation domain-containing protein [Candidatus Omnitrophica bacterium]|nr:prepilin-type N-terminal cleavage/methylation domain-containing protein [Candidatus Omnitrophota bacterium]